ncbi:molybdopterin dinucleotide binding domain-containing protein, partial [Acidianus sp. RZ1]|uniref:molybdopterin dinucleotide binding domain-containing protein n=1 Tax=Acidianus sp. RZ1 TaxID=1540082 RepID=UPI0017FDCF28
YIEYKVPQFAYTSSTDNPILMAVASNSYHTNILQMAWINKETASQLDINEGDWIAIERNYLPNPNGTIPKIVMRAHLTEWIRPDTIGVPEPYGQSSQALTTSIKAIKNSGNKPVSHMWTWSYDPLGGFRLAQQFTVSIRKATEIEISEALQTISAQTPQTLPSQVPIKPSYNITSSEWNKYEET